MRVCVPVNHSHNKIVFLVGYKDVWSGENGFGGCRGRSLETLIGCCGYDYEVS